MSEWTDLPSVIPLTGVLLGSTGLTATALGVDSGWPVWFLALCLAVCCTASVAALRAKGVPW